MKVLRSLVRIPLVAGLFSSSSSSSFDFYSISSYFPSPVERPLSGPSKGGASLTSCCEINILMPGVKQAQLAQIGFKKSKL